MEFCPLCLEILFQFQRNAPIAVLSHGPDNMSLVNILRTEQDAPCFHAKVASST